MGSHKDFIRRVRLAVLLALVGSMLAVPAAFAAEVAGKVTSAASHTGIEDVEVLYYKVGSSDGEFYKLATGSGGVYSNSIAAGQYDVKFVPSAGSGYAFQYYKEKLSSAAADTVTVEEGKKTEVDAELGKADSIGGTVTSAAVGSELADIEVTAYEAQTPNEAVETVDTNSFGKYELKGLPRGDYVLGFKPALESGLNYAPQFYAESARFVEAMPFSLGEGENREFDARLLKGASISGTVTDAATHQPLEGVIVWALVTGAATPVAGTLTDANGDYTLGGLGSGSVVVAFLPESKEDQQLYLPQVYDDRPFPEKFSSIDELLLIGTPVPVTAGLTTTGIDAAIVRREPANAVAPVVSGTAAVGQVLQCSIGTWTGIPTLTYTEQWLRDGTAIAGAVSSEYVVQAGDVGHGLACEVTATNELGSASAISNVLTVPVPTVAGIASVPGSLGPLAVPVVVLPAAKAAVSDGTARVPLTCQAASCAGLIELTSRLTVKRHQGKRTVTKQETQVLAKGSYSLAAGASATIAVHLTAYGKRALAKDHRVAARAVASVSGGKQVERRITLSESLSKSPSKRR